jgi:hypothetical protein
MRARETETGISYRKANGFCFLYTINIGTHICMNIHLYKYMYIHLIPMSSSKRLSWFNLKIHEVGHQKRLTIDGDNTSH